MKLRDLMFFMSIMAIFICAYGVTTQSTLYPGNKLNLQLIRNVINKAYWTIYGDLRILNEISTDSCVGKVDCPKYSGILFTYFALIIYVIVANVLLINLLIAIFR